MKKRARHVMGISGGKDSAALAIYMRKKYPQLDIEYYFCDTGKELEETYTLIRNLEVYLGKKITFLKGAEGTHAETPFDHFMTYKRKYLPSSFNRWCTQYLKLEPFERWIGSEPVISYVGIRGDEDREGYISRKPNIQSIFPFRKNIWSEDVISKVLKNDNIPFMSAAYADEGSPNLEKALFILKQPLSIRFAQKDKLESLLACDTVLFNKAVFAYLKTTNYSLSLEESYPLVTNTDVLVREDIFRTLRESGVGVPEYYEKVAFEVDGQKGEYARSRSGCFFCFYQQRIEWVWLLEQHPELYEAAMKYEKDGYTWGQNESLEELMQPERVAEIKREFLKRQSANPVKSEFLMDILDETEGEGCAACFI